MSLGVHRKVAAEAERLGVSKGQVLRTLIDKGLAEVEREQREASDG